MEARLNNLIYDLWFRDKGVGKYGSPWQTLAGLVVKHTSAPRRL